MPVIMVRQTPRQEFPALRRWAREADGRCSRNRRGRWARGPDGHRM